MKLKLKAREGAISSRIEKNEPVLQFVAILGIEIFTVRRTVTVQKEDMIFNKYKLYTVSDRLRVVVYTG